MQYNIVLKRKDGTYSGPRAICIFPPLYWYEAIFDMPTFFPMNDWYSDWKDNPPKKIIYQRTRNYRFMDGEVVIIYEEVAEIRSETEDGYDY